MNIINIRNYIIIKNIKELNNAKDNPLCCFIIYEEPNKITIWNRFIDKWNISRFSIDGDKVEEEDDTTGLKSYIEFYKYCGKEQVDIMKKVLRPIPIWESEEQMHYSNPKYEDTKIQETIYELDINSSFTYGVLMLPEEFYKFKEYMLLLYDKKKNAESKLTRQKYKNLQNFLIGYLSRIKDFVAVRSKIIENSNRNVIKYMTIASNAGGKVFLSNTDSIITDKVGYNALKKYISNEVGFLKINSVTNKLYYISSNRYQLGNKIVYSGMGYFARKHTDFFNDKIATQKGKFIEPYDFILTEDEENKKVCKIRNGKVIVTVYNKIGEVLSKYIYSMEGD